ncbi:hypothetical protein CDAR_623311 [Caerostris darwini]|uniref:C2H2-type domain-containing protein n=1 Tax=Caerostris darwini TaxID=1538125 RepID=A0AAV4UIP3_9ARAC|nr:hypothetical protein CDAR_623311 [Caerostris darwini]
MGDTSTMHDIEEYMASFSNTNGNSTDSLINLDSSSDEVEIIQELKINLDNHQCDLCCKGTFLVNKLLEFGGVLNDKLKHACDICNQGFKTKSSLTKHKKLHAKGVINENSDIEIELEIPTTKTSVKVNGLSESVMCKVCYKILKTSKSLRKHVMTQHSNKTYICQICDTRFSKFRDFKKHCKAHTNSKPKLLSCPSCKKQFMFKRSLTNHICTVIS